MVSFIDLFCTRIDKSGFGFQLCWLKVNLYKYHIQARVQSFMFKSKTAVVVNHLLQKLLRTNGEYPVVG
jgi:hypothetical protein